VTRDNAVQYDCQAEGFPTPTIIWRKLTGQYFLAFELIIFLYSEKLQLDFGKNNVKNVNMRKRNRRCIGVHQVAYTSPTSTFDC
jgi:hypothetical protein